MAFRFEYKDPKRGVASRLSFNDSVHSVFWERKKKEKKRKRVPNTNFFISNLRCQILILK